MSSSYRHAQIHYPPVASSSFCSVQTSAQGSPYPTLRANPFPKVTDLFCRLPLPTLFHWPEAANLGDLMRLWARPGEWISPFFGFSRTIGSTPDASANKALYLSMNPISRQSVSRARNNYKEKTTLTRASHCNTKIIYVTMQYPHPGWGILTPFLFKKQSKACMCKTSPSLKIG